MHAAAHLPACACDAPQPGAPRSLLQRRVVHVLHRAAVCAPRSALLASCDGQRACCAQHVPCLPVHRSLLSALTVAAPGPGCALFPAAERAQEFQAAYHAAAESMKELIGAPGFVEQVGGRCGAAPRSCRGAPWGCAGRHVAAHSAGEEAGLKGSCMKCCTWPGFAKWPAQRAVRSARQADPFGAAWRAHARPPPCTHTFLRMCSRLPPCLLACRARRARLQMSWLQRWRRRRLWRMARETRQSRARPVARHAAAWLAAALLMAVALPGLPAAVKAALPCE